jgi:AcrR family transcriptional regulator
VREGQILDAAVTVFSRRGYHATSVDEVADAAGISKPMVYAYLGAKEDLFIACLQREGVRLIEALAAAVRSPVGPGCESAGSAPGSAGGGLTPQQKLHRGLSAFLGFVADHREGWTVLYRQARGPFAEVLLPMRTQLVELVTGLFAPAGELAPTLGYAVVGAAEALADWVVDHPSADPQLAASRLAEVLWNGIGDHLTAP